MMSRNAVKIVFVTTNFGCGENGPETYASYLWQNFLADPDVEFHVVAASFPDTHPRWHLVNTARSSFGLYLSLSCAAVRVASQLNTAETILHFNHCHYSLKALKAGFRVFGQVNDYENAELAKRWRFVLRSFGLRRALSLSIRRARERQFVRRQTLTICNSDYTRNAVLEAYQPTRAERVITLHKAVDIAAYRRPQSVPIDPIRRDPQTVRIVFVGGDFIRKGLDILLQAFSQLRLNAHLVVVGCTLQKVIARFPNLAKFACRSDIVFVGRLEKPQLREVLWNSDILAHPARAEALGVAILEAAAAGLQVVTTNVGGIPELMCRLQCGAMIAPEDSGALRLALETAALNKGRCFSEEGLQYFSCEKMIRQVRRFYLS